MWQKMTYRWLRDHSFSEYSRVPSKRPAHNLFLFISQKISQPPFPQLLLGTPPLRLLNSLPLPPLPLIKFSSTLWE